MKIGMEYDGASKNLGKNWEGYEEWTYKRNWEGIGLKLYNRERNSGKGFMDETEEESGKKLGKKCKVNGNEFIWKKLGVK